jgi:hypothetical protein
MDILPAPPCSKLNANDPDSRKWSLITETCDKIKNSQPLVQFRLPKLYTLTKLSGLFISQVLCCTERSFKLCLIMMVSFSQIQNAKDFHWRAKWREGGQR